MATSCNTNNVDMGANDVHCTQTSDAFEDNHSVSTTQPGSSNWAGAALSFHPGLKRTAARLTETDDRITMPNTSDSYRKSCDGGQGGPLPVGAAKRLCSLSRTTHLGHHRSLLFPINSQSTVMDDNEMGRSKYTSFQKPTRCSKQIFSDPYERITFSLPFI